MTLPKIHPVLMSGGAGSRLWPLSRQNRPKQLLPLTGPRSLVQETLLRVADSALFSAPIVVAAEAHRFALAAQMQAVGVEPCAILLEPLARNTAPAAAVAALAALRVDRDALLLLMPADHVIADRQAFLAAVATGAQAAARGRIVTFGITPDAPATGYGYIARGGPLTEPDGVFEVAAFVEKPDLATATAWLEGGVHLWNSGIFLVGAQTLIDELSAHAPGIVGAADQALSRARTDLDFTRLDEQAFAASPSISIDHAVMEKTTRAAVVPVSMGWSDVGSFSALKAVTPADALGNVVIGDVLNLGAFGCYLRSDGPLIAAVGVADLIVVAEADVVLVARLDADQDVKTVVERLKAAGRACATLAPEAKLTTGSAAPIREA